MERQHGEIDLIAGPHDLMHRRVARRDFDDRLRLRNAAIVFRRDLVLADAEGGRDAFAAAGDGGDHLVLLGSGLLEEHRFRRLLDDRADIGERDGGVVGLYLADLDQLLDEAAKTEFLEIDRTACRRPRVHG